jgi:ADP-ribosyl-[dinitrogen reductase] hydrolase
MTHRDVRSLAGASAVAHSVRRLLGGDEREPSLLFRIAADVCRDEDQIGASYRDVASVGAHRNSLSRVIAHVESLLEMPRDRAFCALVDEANRHGAEPTCKRPTMGFPPACIATCLYLLMVTDSFEEALIDVINMGGDADSAGAILGALAGAHYGIDAIPERWLTKLQNREGIELRAVALARRSAAGLEIPDLVESERELSRLERDCREHLRDLSQNGDDLGANRRL